MTDAINESKAQPSSAQSDGLWAYCALACALTWVLAIPAASAWLQHEAPSALAVTCAGLSAFGPLFAVLFVTSRGQRHHVFGRWRASPWWVLLALLTPPAVHLLSRLLYAALGGHVNDWLALPTKPEALAALIVFPLGEEFGWRGFAYPRAVQRFGLVQGALIVGLVWGAWHLAYGITPQKAGFDYLELGLGMIELPLYSLLLAWMMERADRSLALAIALHAGGHLDHIERTPDAPLLLHACHVLVLVALALPAARALAAAE